MAENSKIEWCDHTFNPWEGCTKVSPGCANCYAETLRDKRYHAVKWGKGNPRRRTSEANWRLPLKWNHEAQIGWPMKQPFVFCASLSDFLDDEVPIKWFADLLNLIFNTPHLYWLLLTKRAENWLERITKATELFNPKSNLYKCILEWKHGKPLENVWIGVSVEDQQRADERIPLLLKIPAKVRFLSCEPLIEKIDVAQLIGKNFCGRCHKWNNAWTNNGYNMCCSHCLKDIPLHSPNYGGVHWVICGGESGINARPMHPDWARSLRDQCVEADVPFFFKQWGEFRPRPTPVRVEDSKIPPIPFRQGCTDAYPLGWVERVGKKAAGRLLDGKEWDQFPNL